MTNGSNALASCLPACPSGNCDQPQDEQLFTHRIPLLATMTSEAMVPKELTIIVAATARNMGIGRAGELPWTGLKKEMAYFARVTKRTPPAASPSLVVQRSSKTAWELLTQES